MYKIEKEKFDRLPKCKNSTIVYGAFYGLRASHIVTKNSLV